MHELLFVSLVFLTPVIALAILGGFVVWMVKLLRGGSSGRGKEREDEETRLIQEIYQGLLKMEKRVEALETLLLETKRKEADGDHL